MQHMEDKNLPDTTGASVLDRSFAVLVRWNVEKWLWAILLILTVLSRVIGLGDRAMSHDESLHTVYSWQLYDGRGYQHQPMMHGPLKFILNAVVYFLLGVDDWTSRIQVAVFGIALVWFAWYFRRWMGKAGALATALMLAISPALLYYSRYIRDEVMLCSLMVLLILCMFRYLESRSTGWLIATAVTLATAFLTMEASFIFGGVFGAFLVLALALQVWAGRWPAPNGDAGLADSRRFSFRVTLVVSLAALAVGAVLYVFRVKPFDLILLGIGGVAAVVAVALVVISWRMKLRAFAELDLIMLMGSLVLPFLSAVVLKVLGWQISQFNNPGQITLQMVWQGFLVLAVLFVVSGVIGWFWLRARWFYAAGFFWAIEILFFTTFLTNGQGIGTGLIGSIGYWIEQQAVMRGGQPWYYFWGLVPLYEFLPLTLSLTGGIAWLVWFAKGRYAAAPVSATAEAEVVRPRRASGQTGKAAGEAKGVANPGAAELPVPVFSVQALFDAFLVFWVLATWAVFTYVGEKMAWHVVYFATAMAFLGGLWIGRLYDGIDWRAVRRNRGLWLIVMAPLFLLALKGVFPTAGKKPFVDVTVGGLSNTVQWLLALLVALVLIYLIYDRVVSLGWRQSVRVTSVTLVGLLTIFTLASGYRFAFIDYDYATEPMVYAHATPDIKLAMAQIEEISRKTTGDNSIKVAYDDDSTWPLEWYFRDYPKKAYFGASPSREAVDAPVVVVGDKNLGKVRPYLGDRYYEFPYRLIWWPRETYKGLSFERLGEILRDPKQRGQIWDVIIHRRYATPTAEWDPVHRFSMFVRKDVASQVWDWGAPAAAALTEVKDPYVQRLVPAIQQIGAAGTPGKAPGQFSFPRAVAVDGQGKIYVADSGNNRIQVFNADGTFLRQWGSTCKLDTKEGCQGDGGGQFNEPWGIAVDPDGNVYVADTWNHRIQKFDKDGKFLGMWGVFESTAGELGKPFAFYGPRQLAVGNDGKLYAMDTGNKRVQVINPDGSFANQFGGGGVVDGRLDEPTGLAQDAAGNWFVADTWNRRVQKFGADLNYSAQWQVFGWAGNSVVNKPQMAVDRRQNIIYATDPESFRILAFNPDGSPRFAIGQYGNDAQSFTLPTGIAVGPDGRIYVADGDAHRIMIFPAQQ
jgi:predicted membrane-bound mannosyltransferase/DNA-binding beta-propeller fold protein YncE